MEALQNIIMLVALIAGVVLVVFIIAKYIYLIKKAMIDKGIYSTASVNKPYYLDWGCIILGLGIGVLMASIFTAFELNEDTMDLLIWGTILVFGSIGLLAAHFIRNKFGN